MKVLKWIGIIIVVLIAVIVIAGLILPKEVSLERSVIIDAPKDKVYTSLASFKTFDQWSPWAGMDTNMTYTITDDGSVGAKYSWAGNSDVGKGSMTITHMDDDSIAVNLSFEEPFEDQADTYYLIEETPEGTRASWGFKSSYGMPMNVMMAVMGMKGSIAKDYEKGLDSLKAIIESTPTEPYTVEEIQMEERTYLVKKDLVQFEDFQQFYHDAFPAVFQTISKNESLEAMSMPTGIFYTWDEENRETEMAAGMQINKGDYKAKAPLKTVKIGPGKALKVAYFGAYQGTGAAHNYLENYMKEKGYTDMMVAMEEYVTDPEEEPDTMKWLTNIYYVGIGK